MLPPINTLGPTMIKPDLLLEARQPSRPLASPRFARYFQSVADEFCPYLKNSQDAGVFYSSTYDFSGLKEATGARTIDEALFLVAVAHVEWFRVLRRQLPDSRKILLCDNVVVEADALVPEDALRDLLLWPHWILKCLYSSTGIMFGKFWRGEELVGRNGRQMPPPPTTFLSIRSAVKPKDVAFLGGTPNVASMMLGSSDDGRDVLGALGVPPDRPGHDKVGAPDRTFERAKEWSKQFLPDTSKYRSNQS
jgi:hypothetical protein